MTDAVKSGFGHFSDWKGRASGPAYWWLVLATILMSYVPVLLGGLIGGGLGTALMIIGGIVAVALVFPLISAAVRRFHDTGRSGWWWFIRLVPVICNIWFFVLLILESDSDSNEYGANPAGGVSEPGAAAWEAGPASIVPLDNLRP